MRIAALGYYGYGNVGDELLLGSIRLLLPNEEVEAIPGNFQPSDETIRLLNQYDFILIGGGGLFNGSPPPPFDSFDLWGSELRTPIGVLGVGISSIESEYREATEALVDTARFFVVRDKVSARIAANSRVKVGPDLTFIDLPKAKRARSAAGKVTCGVNLRPGTYRLDGWIKAIGALDCDKRLIPFSTHPAFDDREALKRLRAHCPNRFTNELFSGLDYMIGTAFHSVVVALQLGIPTIAINYSPKVSTFMEEAGLTDYALDVNDSGSLVGVFEKLTRGEDDLRRHIKAFVSEQHEAALVKYREVVDEIVTTQALWVRPSQQTCSVRVNVIVIGVGKTPTEIRKSVESCLDQTHERLILTLVLDEDQPVALDKALAHDVHMIRLANGRGTGWLDVVQRVNLAENVVIINAGGYFSRDAIDAMACALDARPAVDAVMVDTFKVWDGRIDRRVIPSSSVGRNTDVVGDRCVMYRAGTFRKLLDAAMRKKGDGGVEESVELLRIPQGLYYHQSGDVEHLIYCCAQAYSQPDAVVGEAKLRAALSAKSDGTEAFADLLGEVCVQTGYEQSYKREPVAYWRYVSDQLPEGSPLMRAIKRRAVARMRHEEAFVQARAGHRIRALMCFAEAAWRRPRAYAQPGAIRSAIAALAQDMGGRNN